MKLKGGVWPGGRQGGSFGVVFSLEQDNSDGRDPEFVASHKLRAHCRQFFFSLTSQNRQGISPFKVAILVLESDQLIKLVLDGTRLGRDDL